LFNASLRFTPARLARKNAPGVFVVSPRERRQVVALQAQPRRPHPEGRGHF